MIKIKQMPLLKNIRKYENGNNNWKKFNDYIYLQNAIWAKLMRFVLYEQQAARFGWRDWRHLEVVGRRSDVTLTSLAASMVP